MPLPDALRSKLADPAFWAAYRFEDYDEWPDLDDLTVEFPVAPGCRLTLGLGGLSYLSLGCVPQGAAEPVEIAWDDQAHWHPNALRWDELDLFARCLALSDPTLPHPGPVVLLLNRFTPICSDQDAGRAFPLLEAAWRSVLPVEGHRLDDLVEQYDRRHAGFRWVDSHRRGWSLEQSEADRERSGIDLYTLRSAANDEFPYPTWNADVVAAEEWYRRAAGDLLAGAGDGPRALARAAASAPDLTAAAALADALEEVGCQPPDGVLDGLRCGDPGRAGWLIEWMSNSPHGSVVERLCGPVNRPVPVWYAFRID